MNEITFTLLFIYSSNHTANVTVPIIVTIRVQGQANEELRKEVEEAVKQFGFELQINENGAILRFSKLAQFLLNIMCLFTAWYTFHARQF